MEAQKKRRAEVELKRDKEKSAARDIQVCVRGRGGGRSGGRREGGRKKGARELCCFKVRIRKCHDGLSLTTHL